jgi:sporulation protein YlmC with PRC-barrel domain
MRQLRAIIVISILLGLISLTIPIRFYGTMSSIFGTLAPKPFNFAVVRTLTFVFALPAITLILMGIAIYYIVERLDRMAELEVIRESGEVLGHVKKVRVEDEGLETLVTERDREIEKDDILAIDDAVIVRLPENEYVEKEVYSERGEFLGYVKNVESDVSGEVAALVVKKKDKKIVINVADVLNVEKIIIVKPQT